MDLELYVVFGMCFPLSFENFVYFNGGGSNDVCYISNRFCEFV